MSFEEQILRDMLASPFGKSCGQAILDMVAFGSVVTVLRKDCSELKISSQTEAVSVLRLLGWRDATAPSR
jgi:hypothetical protein